MFGPWKRAHRLKHTLTNRQASPQRQAGAKTKPLPARNASSNASPLIFETLEPRLLLAADPLGITAGYAFDETSGTTTADASGHGIIGTLTNGPTFTPGRNGNAVTLDGVNDYVNLGNPTALQLTGSMTVSAWIYSTSFPVDDAAVVSKRGSGEVGFQLDTTIDTGPRTIGFKLTNSSGALMARYGVTTLQLNTWYYITGVYNASAQTLDVYLNGVLDNGVLQGTVTSSQQNSTLNVDIGRRSGNTGSEFAGRIDDVRIADHALTQSQIQTDMATPLVGVADVTSPSAPTSLTATAVLTTQINLSWTAATDNVGVTGYQVIRDGIPITAGATTTTTSYSDTGRSQGTLYSYTIKALDAAGNASPASTAASATTPTLDNTAPTVSLTAPAASSTVTGTVTLSATASDNVSVVGVQFLLDGNALGAEDTTSPYSLSWNTASGALATTSGLHTLAARARDAAGNTTTTTPINITVDNQTPTGTILINNGAAATNITTVTLTLSATDAWSSVTQMRFSNTGSSFSTAEAFATTKTWTLTTGAGTKTVYVQYKDAVGNWSSIAITDTIVLDTTAPTISARTATNITGNSVTITWTTNEAATSQVDYGLTTSYGSTTTLNPTLVTAHSVTITGLAPNTTYNYRVRSKDAAGNEAVSANSTFKTLVAPDTTNPTVTLTAPAANAILAGTVTISATASDNVAVGGVQFLLDGNVLGPEDTTSPYSLSWNTASSALATTSGTHTLAARARDTSGNTATTQLINIIVDNQAPTGTVVINAGAAATNSTTVALTLQASDTAYLPQYPGTITQMRFSNDGTTYSAAEAYATTKTWTLLSDNGPKTVFVQFLDAAGNWSAAATDTILLDTTAPSISAITATTISGTTVTITWTTNEVATSQIDYGTAQPPPYASSTTLDSNLVTSHSVTVSGLTPNTIYNFRVRSRDALGNEALSANGSFINDTIAPSIPAGLNATAVSPLQINLTWNASTDNVAVTGYQVFRGVTQVTTTTSTSYSDTGLNAGINYVYTVSAVDPAGNVSAPSAAANATTLTSDTTAPTVQLTSPTANATVSGTVALTAGASDNVGVFGVQFFVDNVAVGSEDTTSPYSVNWDTTTAANSSHTLTAHARDAAGNAATSAAVTVNVSNSQVIGLAAGYAFDEGAGTTAADASGNGNTATLVGGVTWAPGRYGLAPSFDGIDNYISIPNSASTNISGNALTLSMWIDPQPNGGSDEVVIAKFWNNTKSSPYYQYGLELGGGNRTDFYVGTSSGLLSAIGGTTLPYNQWSYLAITFDGAQVTTYVNGTVVNTQPLAVSITARGNPINVGADQLPSQFYKGLLDDLRIYNRTLTQSQIQADMTTPLGQLSATDPNPPQISIDPLTGGTQVHDIINVTATATDDVGVAGVQFYVDGVTTGFEDTTDPYGLSWDTRTVNNGAHTLTALARDVNGNMTLSAPVQVNVTNTSFFQNEILATGFNLPTAIKFLPDGRMLVVELAGTIKILPAPYTQPDPTPFLQLANVGSAGVQQGIYDIALDPNFTTNHYYYIFYTAGSPNRDRLSRFTANADLTGTVAGSELILYQDGEDANAEHHGGAINFDNAGMLLVTTGENFNAAEAQDLSKPRGKILRISPVDGSAAPGNPFADGPGGNDDRIWALGLRNPYRAYYDAPTGWLIIGDVGGNVYSTAIEEVDIGARGANYGWPNVEAPNGDPAYTAPAYYYPHNGRDSAITGGFVYHGTQFPSSYQGVYFFADYTQNWIRYLTFDANGKVTGMNYFEPADGSVDGPYGDIVYLTQGPEGALYYVDLGYSDISATFGISKIRRISYAQSDLPPVAIASAAPTDGPTPLVVNFSSAGSTDPEGQPLSYQWTFGDATTSTAANPTHTYSNPGQYQVRLSVSDGVNSTLAAPLFISAGNRPIATIQSPIDGVTFKAGDVISFSGTATDSHGNPLPASDYTWNIDFLHEGHVHPGIPITGVTSGSFTIPTSGHDFSGFTRYRITFTVTDSNGLQSSQSVIVYPQKVNLTFDTVPIGLTVYLDGIAHTGPFVYDDLIGFTHTLQAPNQTLGAIAYSFASWSDGGTQQHTIVVPNADQSYIATYNVVTAPAPLAFVQTNAATPQTNQSQVSLAYTSAQVAGDTNIIVIGWNNATSNITSVTDSAGNTYQLAAPVVRGIGISQAIYYAKNIKASAAGANTVSVTFNTATPYVDLRATEYSGLDLVNPLDVTASASGNSATANSGSVTTTAAHELVFGAGTTTDGFSGAGTNFASRIITTPDGDIAEDRFVTATGSYNATAPLSGAAAWVMQVVTFKAAS